MATITSGQTFSVEAGVPFTGSLSVSGFGFVRNWQASGLPSGVTINSSTGIISGAPIEAGNFTFSVGGDEVIQDFVQRGAGIVGNAGDSLGFAVDMNGAGNRVALAGITNDTFGPDAGCVRVYDFDGTGWVKVGGDMPGRMASLNTQGDIITTITYGSDTCRVFQLQGGNWVQLGSSFSDAVWSSLNSSGSRLAIKYGGTKVVLYDWSGNSWVQVGNDILLTNTSTNTFIWGQVAMNASGNRVVIGDPRNNTASTYAGMVRVFDLVNGSWTQVGSNLLGTNYSYFGNSVAMNAAGDRFAAVATGEATQGARGYTRVYAWNGSDWSLLSSIQDEAGVGSGRSVTSVDINDVGDLVVIGAAGNDGAGDGAGNVRIYRLVGASYVQFMSDFDGAAANDQFGHGVAVNSAGNCFVAGAVQLFGAGYSKVYAATGIESTFYTASTNFFNVTGTGFIPPARAVPEYKAYLGSLLILNTQESFRSSDNYARPSEWLSLLNPVANEVRALHAVFDNAENFCTVRMTTTDGSSYFIDWGDGSAVEVAASNTTRTKVYSYSNAALNTGTVAKFGYKQCRVRIYPQPGKTFSRLDLGQKVTSPTGLQTYSSGWLDMNINLPNLAAGANLVIGSTTIRHGFLERVNIVSWGANNSLTTAFRNCHRLRCLNEHEWNTAGIVNLSGAFYSCWALTTLDLSGWNTASCTNFSELFRDATALTKIKLPSQFVTQAATTMASMFQGANSLRSIDCSNWDTRNVTSFASTFASCSALLEVNVSSWNTAKVTSCQLMFSFCYLLQSLNVSSWSLPLCTNLSEFLQTCSNIREVFGCNISAGTTLTNFSPTCHSLSTLTFTGMNATFSVANCNLSASALNTIYTNLSSTGTGKTITVSGNYGTATDTPSIATAKGWTVSG